MNYKDYINLIISKNLLCKEYQKKLLESSGSKKKIFELLADSNGVSFFQELAQKGISTPYNLISEFFKPYINGAYKPTYSVNDGFDGSYTSALYCNYNGSIETDTTLLSLLNCECLVCVPENTMCSIYVDQNSSVELDVMGFNAYVHLYEGAKYKVIQGKDKIKIYGR